MKDAIKNQPCDCCGAKLQKTKYFVDINGCGLFLCGKKECQDLLGTEEITPIPDKGEL